MLLGCTCAIVVIWRSASAHRRDRGERTMAIILSNAGFSDERLVGTLCAGQLIVNGVSLPLDAISTIAAIYTIKWIA